MTASASRGPATASDLPCQPAAACTSQRRGGLDDPNIYIAKGSESYRLSIINWLHVASSYFPHFVVAVLMLLLSQAAWTLQTQGVTSSDVSRTLSSAPSHIMEYWHLYGIALVAFLLLRSWSQPAVYLVDFSVFQPPSDWAVSQKDCIDLLRKYGCYTEESIDFMGRILARSGTGEATHWPPGTSAMKHDPDAKLDVSMDGARAEAQAVIFGTLDDLFAKTGINPKAIDFLIVNCSLFCPTPSLAAMVEQKYNLRRDVRSFNLGGMGCSAGLISVDLAKSLLASRPNSLAVVVSTETITPMMYQGNKRSMLVQNTLFRVGGAAVLLSNKPKHAFSAKYKLLHTVRSQNASPEGYGAVLQCQDEEGKTGVHLSKEITQVAGRGLKDNLTMLGPYVLPIREQVRVVSSMLWRKVAKWAHSAGPKWLAALVPSPSDIVPYVPDFKKGIHHFCVHAGGRAVIDGVEKNLSLTEANLAASRNTLWHYGNTSSSSVWYELAYIEQEEERFLNCKHAIERPIAQGERVLQIAFGSGFKVNSAVWVRLAANKPMQRSTQRETSNASSKKNQ